jgi:hypothetical protein
MAAPSGHADSSVFAASMHGIVVAWRVKNEYAISNFPLASGNNVSPLQRETLRNSPTNF